MNSNSTQVFNKYKRNKKYINNQLKLKKQFATNKLKARIQEKKRIINKLNNMLKVRLQKMQKYNPLLPKTMFKKFPSPLNKKINLSRMMFKPANLKPKTPNWLRLNNKLTRQLLTPLTSLRG